MPTDRHGDLVRCDGIMDALERRNRRSFFVGELSRMSTLDGVFWTQPSDDEERPTDPLGLDAMREELSDVLIPCLTARTWRHEDFFWSLVFLAGRNRRRTLKRTASHRFLHWERCLKLHWAREGRDRFPGVNRARAQAAEADSPSTAFRPLLKNQRAQGMLGAHLGPLRKLGTHLRGRSDVER